VEANDIRQRADVAGLVALGQSRSSHNPLPLTPYRLVDQSLV
jgi:hypothetical protein